MKQSQVLLTLDHSTGDLKIDGPPSVTLALAMMNMATQMLFQASFQKTLEESQSKLITPDLKLIDPSRKM